MRCEVYPTILENMSCIVLYIDIYLYSASHSISYFSSREKVILKVRETKKEEEKE